jgi:hypothetical protein
VAKVAAHLSIPLLRVHLLVMVVVTVVLVVTVAVGLAVILATAVLGVPVEQAAVAAEAVGSMRAVFFKMLVAVVLVY